MTDLPAAPYHVLPFSKVEIPTLMPCPTCDHTMHHLNGSAFFWCPRCGTLADKPSDARPHCTVNRPQLVDYAKRFFEKADLNSDAIGLWWTLGLHEATLLPVERPSPIGSGF